MISITWLILFALIGIAIGVLYSLLVIRNYPENTRKGGYIAACLMFLFVTTALFALISLKINVNKSAMEYTIQMEQNIIENNQDNLFVTHGIDLQLLGNNKDNIEKAVSEIKVLFPSHTELKMDKFLYDIMTDISIKALKDKLVTENESGELKSHYADENNVITVASLLEGIVKDLLNIINIIFLVLIFIFILLLLIYIIKTLINVKNAKKDAENN